MSALLLLAPVAALFWGQGVASAPDLRRAGIERVCVPPDEAEAWRKAGFSATPMTAAAFAALEKLHVPGFASQADVASPTRSPWVFTNGWRYLRRRTGPYALDLPAGKAALAAAEAYAYGAEAVLKIDPSDVEDLGRMAAFLAEVPSEDLPAVADLAVVDDGSPLTGEVMNLLVRRNILFVPVAAPRPEFRVNVRLGTKEYPKDAAADPSAFAQRIRGEIGDDQRTLRVYGSEVVIARLTGAPGRARLHLLNYGGRSVEGLHIRLRGAYPAGEARVAGLGRVPLEDLAVADGATEFSLPRIGTYAVVDLSSP
jgi:hypothetical protein